MNALGDQSFQIFSLGVNHFQSDGQLKDVNRENRETDAHRVNQLRSATCEQEGLETNRDAYLHLSLDVSRVSQMQNVKNAVVVSLIRNEKNVLGASSERSRSCAETPLSETCSSHLSDVACESLELRRWHHPCGGLPWRAERQSL